MRLAAQVKKVLVLAYDDPGFVERPRPESPVVEQVEPTLEDVFGVMSAVAEPNGPRKEATGYRPETSCDLNDDMIRLLRGVGDGGQDVFPLETGIVGEDFVDGGPVGEEFQHVRHADAHAPDAGLSAALSGLDGDAWMDCGRHGLSIPRIHGQSRASKADETVPAAPSPRSGYVRPPAAPCGVPAASDSASPCNAITRFPAGKSNSARSYSGSFLRRTPHRLAWSRTERTPGQDVPAQEAP